MYGVKLQREDQEEFTFESRPLIFIYTVRCFLHIKIKQNGVKKEETNYRKVLRGSGCLWHAFIYFMYIKGRRLKGQKTKQNKKLEQNVLYALLKRRRPNKSRGRQRHWAVPFWKNSSRGKGEQVFNSSFRSSLLAVLMRGSRWRREGWKGCIFKTVSYSSLSSRDNQHSTTTRLLLFSTSFSASFFKKVTSQEHRQC